MKKKNRLAGLLTLICAMVAFTVFLYLIDSSVVDSGDQRTGFEVINIWDESGESFRDTDQFYTFFYRDMESLSEGLAGALQMEQGGSFNGEKSIDIIQYYYRRHPERIPERYQNIRITYKLADLLSWGEYGMMSEGESEEAFLEEEPPAEQTDLSVTEPGYEWIREDFLPEDGISLYDREYPVETKELFRIRASRSNGEIDPSLADILRLDIDDLYRNYQMYNKNQSFLKGNGNFRYALIDPDGRIIKSNLRLDEEFLNREKSVRNEMIAQAFRDKTTYAVYTYGNANVDCGKTGSYTQAQVLTMLRSYDYSFEKGTSLMVCVLDESSNDPILGNYSQNDLYGSADRLYTALSGKTSGLMLVMILAGIAAFICFILFTLTVPTLAKDKIQGFHKIPTLPAAGIMLVLAGLLALPSLIMRDMYDSLSAMRGSAMTLIVQVTWFCLLLEMIAFLYGWYSLVLRIKGKTFFSNSLFARLFLGKDSLLCRIGKWILSLLDRVFGVFAGNKNILIRKMLPYVLFLLMNFIFIAMGGQLNVFSAFLCLVADAVIGVILYLEAKSEELVAQGVERIVEGDTSYQIDTEKMFDGNKKMAQQVNRIGAAIEDAVGKSLRDERMKTELITNVSHDIKTPLTSIINYVDLLKRENIKDEKAQEYIRVLEEKSQRLKVLISDLVDASKISSGNITLELSDFDMRELVSQSLGEFEDRLEERNLTVVYEKPEQPVTVHADSVRLWRVLENLMGNVCKYSLPGSRVYVDLQGKAGQEAADAKDSPNTAGTQPVELTIKNISETALNISAEELMERFVRGDESRNTEGSGLGLSIAGDLTRLMGGDLVITLDGDLFKVALQLPKAAD